MVRRRARSPVGRHAWVPMGQVEVGERLDGSSGDVEVVGREVAFARVPVFNFGVEHAHGYRVTELGVLVHNYNIPPLSPNRSHAPIQSSPFSVRTGTSPGGHPWEAHYDAFGRRIGRTDWDGSGGKPFPHHHTFDPITQRQTGAHLPGVFTPPQKH